MEKGDDLATPTELQRGLNSESQVINWPKLEGVFTMSENSVSPWPSSDAFIEILVDQLASDIEAQSKFKEILLELRNIFTYGGLVFEERWHSFTNSGEILLFGQQIPGERHGLGNALTYGVQGIKIGNAPADKLLPRKPTDGKKAAYIVAPVSKYWKKLKQQEVNGTLGFAQLFGVKNNYPLKFTADTSATTIITVVFDKLVDFVESKLAANEVYVTYYRTIPKGTVYMSRVNEGSYPLELSAARVIPAAMLYFVYLDQKAYHTKEDKAETEREP